MIKKQRNYKLVYTAPPSDSNYDPIEVEICYPIDLELDIKRDTCATSNTATFKLYNLSKNTRELIFQDLFNINRYCFVDLYAGYGDNMPLIFRGKVMQAYSSRSGTEMITEIEALDNDIIQSYSMYTFEADTPKLDVFNKLIQDMPNVQIGAIGSLEGNLPTRTVFDDPTFIAINKLTGNRVFIDNGKLNLLSDNECLGDVGIYQITSDTGLLGSPKRRDAMVEIDVVFAPEITVGQLVDLNSSTVTEFNGQYKVLGVHHHGPIGEQVSGELTTTLSLFVGSLLPNSNYIITGNTTYQPVSTVKNNKVEPVADPTINSIRAIQQEMIKNNRMPHKRITKNIWWDEVVVNFSQQGSMPDFNSLVNLYKIANLLQQFVDKFYPNNRIIITSGWRSKAYNADPQKMGGVVGATNSAHLTGQALDFYLPGQILAYVYRNLKSVWSYRRYMGNGFIHVDLAIEKGPIANDK